MNTGFEGLRSTIRKYIHGLRQAGSERWLAFCSRIHTYAKTALEDWDNHLISSSDNELPEFRLPEGLEEVSP